MFSGCNNLQYVNLRGIYEYYGEDEGGRYNNIFENNPKNMVICMPDNAYILKSFFSQNITCGVIDCTGNWKEKQKKLNGETLACMDSCNGVFKYEYKTICYKKCPRGTKYNEIQKMCEEYEEEEEMFETYEIIETNEFIFEEEKEEINEIFPNIEEEKEEIYEIEEEHIEEEIYEEYDTTYVTEKIITTEIKQTTILNTQYVDECNIINFFNSKCKTNTLSSEQKQELVNDIISKIQDGSLDTLISSVADGEKNVVIETEEETYTIQTTESQNFNESRSLVDLGDCEKELKRVYNLSEDEKIIMFKIEKYVHGYKVPIVGYELFSQNGQINFDIDYCKDIKTTTYVAVELDESQLNKYNPDDEYYNDRCIHHTSENGTDLTIYDRQNGFNDNNMSLCESNCEYKGYDSINKITECECNIKNVKNVLGDTSELLNEFKSV